MAKKPIIRPLAEFGSTGDQYLSSKTGGFILDFYSVATGRSVAFKGFMTEFTDNFQASYNEESVYGRMDPIVTYQGTQRNITFGWDVVAVNMDEAISNLSRIENLMTLLYPKYNSGQIQTIQSTPLIKVRFANFIVDAGAVQPLGDSRKKKSGFVPASESGLMGAISGFSYSPNFEPGMFMTNDGRAYPKHVAITCDMRVLHTHNLGWNDKNNWRGDKGSDDISKTANDVGMGFPYGTDSLTKTDHASRLASKRREDVGNFQKTKDSRFDAQKDRAKGKILGGS